MNDSPKNETENIRSDIDTTRRRMDDTMDALGDRLQPRHLLDEVLGYLRGSSSDGESRLKHMGERLGHSCNTAMHSVVDSVKQNPMPAVLIGAGVAWMIYSNRRDAAQRYDFEEYTASDARRRYDPDSHYDRPLDYPSTADDARAGNSQGETKLGAMKDELADKASSAADQVKGKLAQAGDAAREKIGALRDRASEIGGRVREGTRETYERARERVISTTDHHPLEVGLAALAVGLIAGLAIPTPNAINRSVGPTADRLRSRTREAGNEMLQKGKRVADAAVAAVKEEAEAQGLTPERLRSKAGAVAERAKDAGQEAASREGLTSSGTAPMSGSPAGSDPTVARPGV
jgi:ElaB/YqjD/DUF883 family membrane-anchored ribosome-binding protein